MKSKLNQLELMRYGKRYFLCAFFMLGLLTAGRLFTDMASLPFFDSSGDMSWWSTALHMLACGVVVLVRFILFPAYLFLLLVLYVISVIGGMDTAREFSIIVKLGTWQSDVVLSMLTSLWLCLIRLSHVKRSKKREKLEA